MAFVKTDDIRGYRFDSEVLCLECVTDDDLNDLEHDNIITSNEVDRTEGYFFCDRCGKAL